MMVERHDPTPAEFPPPMSGSGDVSGNEVEALCVKAARGAGYDWGMAEEAGFAARWLCSRGIDGPGALLCHLDHDAGEAPGLALLDNALRPVGDGFLCPIAVGAALSDFAALGQDQIETGEVHRPLLVLPFLYQIAQGAGSAVALNWSGGRVTVTETGEVAGDVTALAQVDLAEIAVAPTTEVAAETSAVSTPTGDTLARLNAYAMRTTVPATDASRADAGSAKGDND